MRKIKFYYFLMLTVYKIFELSYKEVPYFILIIITELFILKFLEPLLGQLVFILLKSFHYLCRQLLRGSNMLPCRGTEKCLSEVSPCLASLSGCISWHDCAGSISQSKCLMDLNHK